ncbi:MAG: hypothetical protein J7604_17120 [Sporocytophaga sp.]|uniref:hypothetical protein n=1 Tax=Sporocytophaga sp. TaxID=2231183 RepID=UPI001B075042|nr:hypothetical protein [Sporocytophaga sp.]MBO9701933.1 hypothetical protein [Sporocytophaga sp.]
MAVYKVKNQNIQTSGDGLQAFIEGLGSQREMGIEILSKYGIHNPQSGQWYSLEGYLKALEELEKIIGGTALYSVGEKIPKNAIFPPEVDSIEKALSTLNIGFHMNHSLDGKSMMFNPANGTFEGGIGNYIYKQIKEGEAEITVDNAYPTSFDEGLIFAVAQRFNTASFVSLVDDQSSRSKGGEKDVYRIQWF